MPLKLAQPIALHQYLNMIYRIWTTTMEKQWVWRAALSSAILTSLSFVHAQTPPVITLTSSGCILDPPAGISSRTVDRNEVANGDAPPVCLFWSYDTSLFSVKVTVAGSQISSGYCNVNDFLFAFMVTYIASSCTSTLSTLTFTAVNGVGSTNQQFSINVKCALTPSGRS
jgi:hypothetical protein